MSNQQSTSTFGVQILTDRHTLRTTLPFKISDPSTKFEVRAASEELAQQAAFALYGPILNWVALVRFHDSVIKAGDSPFVAMPATEITGYLLEDHSRAPVVIGLFPTEHDAYMARNAIETYEAHVAHVTAVTTQPAPPITVFRGVVNGETTYHMVAPGADGLRGGFLMVAQFDYQVEAEEFIDRQRGIPRKQMSDPHYDQKLNYHFVENQMKKLAGETLTVMDASFVNEGQNMAVKSLVKKAFRSTLSYLWEYVNRGPNCVQSEGKAPDDVLD